MLCWRISRWIENAFVISYISHPGLKTSSFIGILMSACSLNTLRLVVHITLRLHYELNVHTHVKHRTCTSFVSARAIFITRRCNNRVVTAVLGRLPHSLHVGQMLPPFITSLNEYSSFLIVFSTLQDTRTHVVVELYDTERSYVEALQILVNVSTYWLDPKTD